MQIPLLLFDLSSIIQFEHVQVIMLKKPLIKKKQKTTNNKKKYIFFYNCK